MTRRPVRLLRPLLLAALLLPALTPLRGQGESRTFTSKDGRTIEAEVLGFKGETLRIRRVDTGREVQLPVSALAEEDQRSVRKFIRENPALRDAVKPGDIRVEFSRAKFERETTATAYWRDENVESWGFSIGLLNQTNVPVEGLRVDYVLFARIDPDEVYSPSRRKSEAERMERTSGSEHIAALPSLQRVTVRTKPVVTTRVKYTDGARIITNDGKLRASWRDKALHGVWFRVYDGDTLVHEASSPDNLRTNERWD